MRAAVLLGFLILASAACDGGGEPEGEPVLVRIPRGASLTAVAETLAVHRIVDNPDRFTLFVRVRGDAERLQAGAYTFRRGQEWGEITADLIAGRVFTERFTVPEGLTLDQIAVRIAENTGVPVEDADSALRDEDAPARFELPGPTLEGYLFPETYTITPGTTVDEVLEAMIRQYRAVWTPDRLARRDSLGLSERELVTLASIVQAEGRVREEFPVIASVYHNRLRIGMPLQADPTVIYALGGPRERLLYAAMDSVADSPYNTYTHAGLPPGPIGSPGLAAIEATLAPADTDFLYFVARPDGSHAFSRSLAEHNRARAESDRLRDSVRAAARAEEARIRDSIAAAARDTLEGG